MYLKPEIKKALEQINFLERYKMMSKRYYIQRKYWDTLLEHYDVQKVIALLQELGYKTMYDKKESFFKTALFDNAPHYQIWCNIVLRSGTIEFIWTVFHNNEVRLGSPWGVYAQLLVDPDYIITDPFYRSYDELKAILKEAFEMYEDFKQAIINDYELQ